MGTRRLCTPTTLERSSRRLSGPSGHLVFPVRGARKRIRYVSTSGSGLLQAANGLRGERVLDAFMLSGVLCGQFEFVDRPVANKKTAQRMEVNGSQTRARAQGWEREHHASVLERGDRTLVVNEE